MKQLDLFVIGLILAFGIGACTAPYVSHVKTFKWGEHDCKPVDGNSNLIICNKPTH